MKMIVTVKRVTYLLGATADWLRCRSPVVRHLTSLAAAAAAAAAQLTYSSQVAH